MWVGGKSGARRWVGWDSAQDLKIHKGHLRGFLSVLAGRVLTSDSARRWSISNAGVNPPPPGDFATHRTHPVITISLSHCALFSRALLIAASHSRGEGCTLPPASTAREVNTWRPG